jgi:Ser/Thr protein kinase RdoA (MazF antagonist)
MTWTERRLAETYGFEVVEVGERLSGGYANDLYRVRADGADLVLRVKRPPAHEEDVAWEHELIRGLARALPEVQAPLETHGGDTSFALEDRRAWLIPFVEGRPADETREEHRLAAAAALGRLHRAAMGLDLPQRPLQAPLPELEWPPLARTPELAGAHEVIAEAREWAIGFVGGLEERELPWGVIHGDYFPGNVLVAEDARVTAILDWEEAHADWLTWDLACAAGSFCSHGDDFDRGAFRRFAAAYRAAGGPAREADDDLLEPLLRVKRVLEILRAPTDRDPRWDLQDRNVRSLAALANSA